MTTKPRFFTLRESPPLGERIDLYDPQGYRIVWTGKRWYDPQDSDGSLQGQEAWPPDGDGPWVDRAPITKQAARDALRAYGETLYGTDEEVARERDRQFRALKDWHAELLRETAGNPVLHALIEAHGPKPERDGPWAHCSECPEVNNQDGDSDPEYWPCGVWIFISDRMETP